MAWYRDHNKDNCEPVRGKDGKWWGGHDAETDPVADRACPATTEAEYRNLRERK